MITKRSHRHGKTNNLLPALLFIPATSTFLRTVKFGDRGNAIVPREKQATVSFSSSHSVHCSYISWAKLHDSSTQAHFKSGVKAALAPHDGDPDRRILGLPDPSFADPVH